jgi:MoaA/NifB/PqqE/SkfB family radical SAM enzyme
VIDPGRFARLLAYPAFRAGGFPRLLPMNLTVSVTNACPSRCQTCDIWKQPVEDLTTAEYTKVFRSLGRAPVWVTLSGGDQFLRRDLPEVVRLCREILRPAVINLPMNGILTRRIETLLPEVAAASRGSELILNLSIDEIGERHDALRGHRNNYEKIQNTYRFARELQREYPHIVVGIHTVVSRFNVDRFREIHDEVMKLAPDSFITEIAEQRAELRTLGKDIAPTPEAYAGAIDHLKAAMRQKPPRRMAARLVYALRLEYYELVKRTLKEHTQVIPCYAGWASAHLAPDGEVWGCAVRAESIGNVRDHDYDFGRVWFSERADRFRDSVRAKECACPLASAAYTNMLFSPASLMRVTRALATA